MRSLTNVRLIFGGAASGKSAVAEQFCSELGGRCVYIATMQPFGPDAEKRIRRHYLLRKSRGFDTVEHYGDLADLTLQEGYDVALLEDAGNLLSNLLFGQRIPAAQAAQRAVQGIAHLAEQAGQVVVVSNTAFSDGVDYAKETQGWIMALAELNNCLARAGAVVTEVICGVPIEKPRVMECSAARQAKRVLILGGAYQGKSERARMAYADLCATSGLVDGLHREIAQRLRDGGNIDVWLEELLSREEWIITCTEIGGGVVPVDRFEREWREVTGRICHALAQRADRIEQVSCGIAVPIKG